MGDSKHTVLQFTRGDVVAKRKSKSLQAIDNALASNSVF
jgi:hypothetical protein